MENFILYEELGAGSSSVVFKGRRKGYLNYLAIIRTDKAKRPEITNHVRLSSDLDHPNIVSFYEWYETCHHLWLVVELCTGGSLQHVISQDGGLPEREVKRLGWGLVKGLKHIHEFGIVFSDLTPAKILLDVSGVLKFGNFRFSKAEGETLEDVCSLLSTCEKAGEEDFKENLDNMMKRLQGSPIYRAPEVFRGSETTMSSDLWALGSVLYYMYTGKPPFYSDSDTELIDMILHQEPSPPRQTVFPGNLPSEDFQTLLKGLLNKDPDKRMNWEQLLRHRFWTQGLNEEDLDKERDVDNVSGLRPKSGVDKDNAEEIFLLSSCATSRRSYWMSDSLNDTPAPHRGDLPAIETIAGTDFTSSVKVLLHTDSDQTVSPVMDNPKIFKNPPLRFDPKTLCMPAYSVGKLQSLSDEEWSVFIQQLCSSLEEQNTSTPPRASTATRSRLSLLGYLCSVVTHEAVANRLMNSTLLPVLNQQLRQTLNWDVRSRVLRLLGILAMQCTELKEDSPVSEVVSTLTDLLRENLRNSKVKQFLLPPLGEFLYLIASQEEKRGSPEGLWFVPAAAYTGLMRSLREGFLAGLQSIKHIDGGFSPVGSLVNWPARPGESWNRPFYWFPEGCQRIHYIVVLRNPLVLNTQYEQDDPIVHHMAAKAIENIFTKVSDPSHRLITLDVGQALWYLFSHSTLEAVRVTAISALSKITQVAPAVFLAVIDTYGAVVILEGVGGAGARVQLHLLSAVATAIADSRIHTQRITQSTDLVLKVLQCLKSPSTITRAKALLLLLLLMKDNTHTLLFCCQHRLVMYLERDLHKSVPLKESPGQSKYLSQCLDLVIVYLRSIGSSILEDVISALGGVIGRRHPSTVQSRQLKQTLPTVTVVLALLSSQAFRSHSVSQEFLTQIGLLLSYITSVESNETSLVSAVGAALSEDLIRTSLSIVEVLSQHHALISPYHSAVVGAILPPLMTLVFSKNVEWSVFVLRVLSELSLVLLVQEGDSKEDKEEPEEEERRGEEGGTTAVGRDEGSSSSQIIALITKSLLPRYESLLQAAEPIQLYALKLLVSMTDHSSQICRLIQHNRILLTVFQLILGNRDNITSGMVQNAVSLLCNLTGDTVFDLEPPYQQGLMEVVTGTLPAAIEVHLEGEVHAGRRLSPLVLQALLELLHNILKQTSIVVCSALQSQRLSCPAAETEAAETLLFAHRPLSQLSTHLTHMLSSENRELGEESLQCLSLLVQLYGGQVDDCLSPSCLHHFSRALCTNIKRPKIQLTAIKIIKRLVQTAASSDWLEYPEGAEFVSLLQDMTSSNRYHVDVVQLAAEILREIFDS
ncbi:serine/threonine-protein kinase ULK4 [Aulostomus maculatus]